METNVLNTTETKEKYYLIIKETFLLLNNKYIKKIQDIKTQKSIKLL